MPTSHGPFVFLIFIPFFFVEIFFFFFSVKFLPIQDVFVYKMGVSRPPPPPQPFFPLRTSFPFFLELRSQSRTVPPSSPEAFSFFPSDGHPPPQKRTGWIFFFVPSPPPDRPTVGEGSPLFSSHFFFSEPFPSERVLVDRGCFFYFGTLSPHPFSPL